MNDRLYPARPIVGIGIAVLRGSDLLLIRRARPPGQNLWSLPGGAQDLGETAHAAARRELFEETGITCGPLHLAAVIDSIHHDSAGAVAYHYTIIDFASVWLAGEPRAATDAAAALFVPVNALGDYALSPDTRRVIEQARTLLAEAAQPT